MILRRRDLALECRIPLLFLGRAGAGLLSSHEVGEARATGTRRCRTMGSMHAATDRKSTGTGKGSASVARRASWNRNERACHTWN